ncbi:MAG: MFS transporter [Candidatus Dormibacteraeota bacterium]|nr:MFS transporter [Candidatus Dormibacteraeota bacterium]
MARLAAAVLVSSIGDPFSQVVSLVLLYQATRAPLAIAAAYGAEMLGVLTVGGLLGAAADRVDRRRLIVGLEAIRFLVVASLPLVTSLSVFLLYPVLFLLASIETLVQPSRQAALPELVTPSEVSAGNALLMTAMTVAQAAGFAFAGTALSRLSDPRPLYLIDALSFALASLLIASLGNLGGGIVATKLRGGVGRAWMVPGVRPLLIIATATVLFVGMLNPTLLPVAYALSSNGPTAYTLLEVCLISGGLVGSLAIGRIGRRQGALIQVVALWMFGAGVLAVGVSHSFLLASFAVALSGAGNAIYSVTNTSALMETATSRNRGTVMSARFTVTRTSMALGLAAGAATASWLGPLRAFSSFGLGLLLVAVGFTAFLLVQRHTLSAGRRDLG